MLTKIKIVNFKKFGSVEFELGNPVVFIGPNNSGKTSSLQALALWETGVKRWSEKRGSKRAPEKRPGVTINRKDLVAIPVPDANLLWRDLHVRDVKKSDLGRQTQNIRIDIVVEGVNEDKEWRCGLEFDYGNEESFYCRPLRLSEGNNPQRMAIPPEAEKVQVAFLPPMSGLSANETRLDHGAINVRVGEGRTAEVLRNLCFKVFSEMPEKWKSIVSAITVLFGSKLGDPEYVKERGEIRMRYKEHGTSFDLSSSGRGLQQTLLLLAYMYANRGAVLLLDEPDAHLEILRQRQIYQLLVDVARENNNQVIAASHSEILLNEAAERDVVIAFVGKPHRIDDRGTSQTLKALREIGFEHYYQAEQTGWVLYLEGSTDLAILRALAKKLNHKDALEILDRPFVHYVGNLPAEVRKHFFGVKEAVPNLKGVAIFDHLEQTPPDLGARFEMWSRKEIESYLCYPETLLKFATSSVEEDSATPLFAAAETQRHKQAMEEAMVEVEQALKTLGQGSPWDKTVKVSDLFLTPLFDSFYKKLSLPNIMAKKNFHELARFLPDDKIDAEIKQKLDAIVEIAKSAKPEK